MSHKTPSVILLDQDQKFHSFGYEAEDKYAKLTTKKEHKDWHYFTRIKMKLMTALDTFKGNVNDTALFKERLKRETVIKDMEDREFPLLDLMGMAYKNLIDHFLKQLDEKSLLEGITPSTDIQWVITVPAIWTDASKQFTKLAAVKAGLSEHQIKLAYEPEAAALYCRLLPVDKFVSGGEQKSVVFSTFERGKKFMVIDLGGGTVDISVQETTSNGQMKSIHKVCGGPWGGQAVDEEFRKCIQRIFGGEVLNEFRNDYRSQYLAFFRDFELKKRKANLTSNSSVKLRIPAELCDLLEDTTDCDLAETLANSSFTGKIKAVQDKLDFSQEQFYSFFSGALDNIKNHIISIFEDQRCQNLTGILLVGGFAESDIVIEYLRRAFPEQTFIVPSQAGLSVVMGAVLYGHEPDIICARTCRYTYGTSVAKPFRNGIDPLQKRFILSNEYFCNDRFAKTFTIGELVNIGDRKSIHINIDYRDEERQILRYKPIDTEILISRRKDPIFSDEDDITKLGEIVVPLPDEGVPWPEYFGCSVFMEIAGTEIDVTCTLDTGESVKGSFEFLIE
ncbi:hypothetical protein FSP39_005241 [Pinctada imbricata]|uniref:Uncharacterized protein n=1 Tax=Pinctada imbricata TaxID=66713 RepID=A0AA89C5A0_PINIB|nr:hypothetical protein FSP39_005241 [Pinctada imbricata]